MASIDKLLEKMAQKDAQRVVLCNDQPIRLSVAGREASGPVLASAQLRSMIQEITPPELRSQSAFQFSHDSPYGTFDFNVVNGNGTLRVTIIPRSGIEDKLVDFDDLNFDFGSSAQNLQASSSLPSGHQAIPTPQFSASHQINSQGKGTIELTRNSQFYNQLWPYTVYIDNGKVGQIKNGETVKFEVLSGAHELETQVGSVTSEAYKFQIAHGEKLSVEVGSTGQDLLYVRPSSPLLWSQSPSTQPVTQTPAPARTSGLSKAGKEAEKKGAIDRAMCQCGFLGAIIGWGLDIMGVHMGSIGGISVLSGVGLIAGMSVGWFMATNEW